ncbi:hypothetical protein HOP50_10g60390 [Chloropicon primus]|uniref:Uncharacterized protein n=1 Tax=Chloropicon primus TaxID=1764295 RepID=A0A5B8MVM2_9CHLO|nr:hypothetical protein A3770_10p60180 [Chloropicon primus]UPR02712.1 hypothetical protein HOP50_10g60390 [Chloropicon primus]|eukprot:QDZ23500.1 hypothetical protein A3770_10p60180 [Chloropicon primus]
MVTTKQLRDARETVVTLRTALDEGLIDIKEYKEAQKSYQELRARYLEIDFIEKSVSSSKIRIMMGEDCGTTGSWLSTGEKKVSWGRECSFEKDSASNNGGHPQGRGKRCRETEPAWLQSTGYASNRSGRSGTTTDRPCETVHQFTSRPRTGLPRRSPSPGNDWYNAWLQVFVRLNKVDQIAFAMTCKGFRKVQAHATRSSKIITRLDFYKQMELPNFSRDWYAWAYNDMKPSDSFEEYKSFDKSLEGKGGNLFDHDLMALAALQGSLDRVMLLRSLGCSWSKQTCACAGLGGYLDVLMWVRSMGCPWDELTHANAAFGGHLNILKWAWSQGLKLSSLTCSCAARAGRLDIVKWALSEGCRWDAITLANAAYGGHLDILKWAQSLTPSIPDAHKIIHGCATRGGHEAVIEWANQCRRAEGKQKQNVQLKERLHPLEV